MFAIKPLLVIILVVLLQACSSKPAVKQPSPASLNLKDPTVAQLMTQYQSWRGVPYKLGGNSKRGIDCSAFVQQTYGEQFTHTLPRTTYYQAKKGRHVNKSSLQTGDMVFFLINGKTRHVGMYLGEGLFLHASTSKGVTISKLNNPYWRKHYWMARRVR